METEPHVLARRFSATSLAGCGKRPFATTPLRSWLSMLLKTVAYGTEPRAFSKRSLGFFRRLLALIWNEPGAERFSMCLMTVTFMRSTWPRSSAKWSMKVCRLRTPKAICSS